MIPVIIPLKLKWKEKDSLRNQLMQSEQVIPTVFGNTAGLAACTVQCLAMQLHSEKKMEGSSPRSCGKRCKSLRTRLLYRYTSTMALVTEHRTAHHTQHAAKSCADKGCYVILLFPKGGFCSWKG